MCLGENLERKRERESAQKSAPKCPNIYIYIYIFFFWGYEEGLWVFISFM